MAYPEAIEGSLRLGAVALQMAGVASDEVSSLLQEVRGGNYELVSKHRDPSRAGQA
jgi:hypothetical protein